MIYIETEKETHCSRSKNRLKYVFYSLSRFCFDEIIPRVNDNHKIYPQDALER